MARTWADIEDKNLFSPLVWCPLPFTSKAISACRPSPPAARLRRGRLRPGSASLRWLESGFHVLAKGQLSGGCIFRFGLVVHAVCGQRCFFGDTERALRLVPPGRQRRRPAHRRCHLARRAGHPSQLLLPQSLVCGSTQCTCRQWSSCDLSLSLSVSVSLALFLSLCLYLYLSLFYLSLLFVLLSLTFSVCLSVCPSASLSTLCSLSSSLSPSLPLVLAYLDEEAQRQPDKLGI